MPLMIEHWKPISGLETHYAVSNVGNVRRLVGGSRTQANKLLKPLPNSEGYIVLTLCVDGKRHKKSVHTLVAEHFIGPCPDGMEVNHHNGWKSKNWASNLEYATPKQNIQHAWRTGLCRQSQYTPEQVEEIKSLHLVITQKEMVKRFGGTIGQIKNIFRTRTKERHAG